jgi:hypothetical protein
MTSGMRVKYEKGETGSESRSPFAFCRSLIMGDG